MVKPSANFHTMAVVNSHCYRRNYTVGCVARHAVNLNSSGWHSSGVDNIFRFDQVFSIAFGKLYKTVLVVNLKFSKQILIGNFMQRIILKDYKSNIPSKNRDIV